MLNYRVQPGLMALSHGLGVNWPIVILTLTGLVAGLTLLMEVDVVAKKRDWLSVKMPLIGVLNHKRCLSRMATTLGILLASGIDLLTRYLKQLERSLENRYIKMVLIELRKRLRMAQKSESGYGRKQCIPQSFCQLVAIGEASGSLPEVLETLNIIYTDEIQARNRC